MPFNRQQTSRFTLSIRLRMMDFQHALMFLAAAFLSFLSIETASSQTDAASSLIRQGWPQGVRKIELTSSRDGSKQPALMYSATSKRNRPLLVALHTWSGNYLQAGGEVVYARWCMENDWHFIHPDFRGPNRTPQALGSDYVVQDILDAVEFMKKHKEIDADRVYLIGVSGGGHAALLMAGTAPKVWAGVSAWCPISDVEKWWAHHAFKEGQYKPARYAKDIELAVGGRPDLNRQSLAECRKRSPITFLSKSTSVNLDINHGIQDGRKGSVPFTHSIEAFNRVAQSSQRISNRDSKVFYESLELPTGMRPAKKDSSFGSHQPVYRVISRSCRLTIFQGGHEIVHVAALNWLARQRRGKPADWSNKDFRPLKSSAEESAANR